jgi:hypothetical protein
MDPAWHPIDYNKLELRTLALARCALLVTSWREFLAAEPGTLDIETMEDFVGDALSPDWSAGPVAALAPDSCEEFRAISKTLGKLWSEDREAHAKAYEAAPLLFRLGCDFSEAVETMDDEDMDEDEVLDALQKARMVWFKIATAAKDAGK